MATPYMGFTNDTLSRCARVHAGDSVLCPICGDDHLLEPATTADGEPSELLLFYKCGDETYLGAVAGRLTVGKNSDFHGTIGDENNG